MSAPCDELLRLVVALSGACKQDKNVLKDGELVDALEKHGREITWLRKQQKKTRSNMERIHMSPPQGCNKMAKKDDEQVLDKRSTAAEGTPKRRKLSMVTDTKLSPRDSSHDLDTLCIFPSIECQPIPKRLCTEEWIASLQSNKKAATIDSAEATDCYRPTTVVAVKASEEAVVMASKEAVMANPHKMRQYNHMRRPVLSQLKASRAVRVASPFEPSILDRAASPSSVDLSASSTSTMASYYDMCDEYKLYPETMHRYTRSALDRTCSFESMDWMPSDDSSSDEFMEYRSIADDGEQQSSVSRRVTHESSTHSADARLDGLELRSKHSDKAYYVADESDFTRITPVKHKNKLSVAPSSTEVVMEVLYGIMEHNENFKWLIDPMNQARVAKLVEYHLRDQHNNDASIQAFKDKQFINELRAHVDKLIHENLKIKTENVRLMGKGSQSAAVSAAVDRKVDELERRLATSEETVSMQEKLCREAEVVFQNELATTSKLVSSLQHDIDVKDFQIASLVENGAELSTSSDVRSPELSRLKNTVMEKNRESCCLNFQLLTKQKLVNEIARKVVQQLESTLNVSSCETLATLANGLCLDMDMFLFRSIAEKQQTIEELKAALLSMEHEVRGLEAQVAKKTRDTLLLKTKFKSMSSRLTEANVSMSRVQAENDGLVASLKEKKEKMHDLIQFLEGKEKQVMQLEEQVDLRQMQLEHVTMKYEKMQRQQFDKKSTNDHLSASS